MGNRFGKKRKKNPMEPPPVASRPSNTEQPLEQELATAEEDLNETGEKPYISVEEHPKDILYSSGNVKPFYFYNRDCQNQYIFQENNNTFCNKTLFGLSDAIVDWKINQTIKKNDDFPLPSSMLSQNTEESTYKKNTKEDPRIVKEVRHLIETLAYMPAEYYEEKWLNGEGPASVDPMDGLSYPDDICEGINSEEIEKVRCARKSECFTEIVKNICGSEIKEFKLCDGCEGDVPGKPHKVCQPYPCGEIKHKTNTTVNNSKINGNRVEVNQDKNQASHNVNMIDEKGDNVKKENTASRDELSGLLKHVQNILKNNDFFEKKRNHLQKRSKTSSESSSFVDSTAKCSRTSSRPSLNNVVPQSKGNKEGNQTQGYQLYTIDDFSQTLSMQKKHEQLYLKQKFPLSNKTNKYNINYNNSNKKKYENVHKNVQTADEHTTEDKDSSNDTQSRSSVGSIDKNSRRQRINLAKSHPYTSDSRKDMKENKARNEKVNVNYKKMRDVTFIDCVSQNQ